MGYNLHCLLASGPVLASFKYKYPQAKIVHLAPGLFIIPLTDDFIRMYPLFKDSLPCVSEYKPCALLEAEYFGGTGTKNATFYHKGEVRIWKEDPQAFNEVLKLFEVKAGRGIDEFDTVGFGRHRNTDDWVAGRLAPGQFNPTIFEWLNDDWGAEVGTPEVKVEITGDNLNLSFYANHFIYKNYKENDRIVLTFKGVKKYRLGSTNDEGWYRGQCRFSSIAPQWGEFYEIFGDTLMEKSPHDWIDLNFGKGSRHFLFYFHDNTFECQAETVEFEHKPIPQIQFGDIAKIKFNQDTEKLGVAGLTGSIYGETKPSISNVEIIGVSTEDFALNIYIEEKRVDYWFPREYLEFISHAPGTDLKIGDSNFIRKENGEWVEKKLPSKKFIISHGLRLVLLVVLWIIVSLADNPYYTMAAFSLLIIYLIYSKLKRDSETSKIQMLDPRELHYSQLDFYDLTGVRPKLGPDEWVKTIPFTEFYKDAYGRNGLPEKNADIDTVYKVATKMSKVRESVLHLGKGDGVYCPICHIVNIQIEKLHTPCPECGRALLLFGWT